MDLPSIDKMLAFLSPEIRIFIICLLALLWAFWHFFIQEQRENFKCLLDAHEKLSNRLIKDNEEVRKELAEFKEENKKLKAIIANLQTISAELKAQPILSKETTNNLANISLQTQSLISFNEEIRYQIIEANQYIVSGLKRIDAENNYAYKDLVQAIKQIEVVVHRKEAKSEAISKALQEVLDIIVRTEAEKRMMLTEVAARLEQTFG